MNLYKDLPTWAEEYKTINCIVEINKNSMVKYEFDKENNAINVDRFFTCPMPIPYNYWLIPNTYNQDDKDPLDVIILSEYELMPWCTCQWKVVGILHMIDWWEKDDKIIAVPEKEPFFDYIQDINEMPKFLQKQFEFFLNNYKKIDWKKTEVAWWSNKEKAIQEVKNCQI